MRENGHQPFGFPPENSACGVAALEHGTTMPRALRLATTIFRGNGSMNNFETASDISSIAAICEMGLVSYKASKAALNAYTHTLATGGAKFGIRANVIMPGLMDTPMAIEGYVAAGYERQSLIEKRNASVPLGGKMGTAWDVANAALFLASDEAKFITGVCLPVDGGQSALIG